MISALINFRTPSHAQSADHVCIFTHNGVTEIGDATPPPGANIHDLQGGWLLPGFLDLQVNGGGGVLLNNDPTPAGIDRIIAAHRACGTAGLLATVITDAPEIRRAATQAACDRLRAGTPGLLGVHFEGPFINPAKAGVHAPEHIAPPSPDALAEIAESAAAVRAAGGAVLLTVAPEMFALNDLRTLAAQGVILAAGHSAADYRQATAAFDAGVGGVTHLFNAMTGLESRAPGLVGAALDRDDVWCGVIADGLHVHPAALRLALRAKGPAKLALVSDAMACAGAGAPPSFELYGRTIRSENGRLIDAAGRLAGADIVLADAVRNMAMRFNAGGDPATPPETETAPLKTEALKTEALKTAALKTAAAMASYAPAAALRLQGRRGRLAPGAAADFTWLDADLKPRGVWSAGEFYPCGALPLA